MYIPKLRKLDKVAKIIKQQDANTAITEYLIEQLIKKKYITRIKYGNSWLINLDELYKFFINEEKK